FQSASPFAQQLDLSTPMVLVNGSEVRESPGKVMFRAAMDPHHVTALRETALRHDLWYWGYSTEGVFNRDRWLDQPDAVTWLKFGFYSENVSALAAAEHEARNIGDFEITNSHPNNLELNPLGIN